MPAAEFVTQPRAIDWGKLSWRLAQATEGVVPAISADQAALEASHSPGGDANPDEILFGRLTRAAGVDDAWVVVFHKRPCHNVGGAAALPTTATTSTTMSLCESAVAIDATSGAYIAAIVFR